MPTTWSPSSSSPGDGHVLGLLERTSQRQRRAAVVEVVADEVGHGPVPVDALERIVDAHRARPRACHRARDVAAVITRR